MIHAAYLFTVFFLARGESVESPDSYCEGCGEGCDADDHLLLFQKDELQRLNLLQMEVRLQSEVVVSAESQALPQISAAIVPSSHHLDTSEDVVRHAAEVKVPSALRNSASDDRSQRRVLALLSGAHFHTSRDPKMAEYQKTFRNILSTVSLLGTTVRSSRIAQSSGWQLWVGLVLAVTIIIVASMLVAKMRWSSREVGQRSVFVNVPSDSTLGSTGAAQQMLQARQADARVQFTGGSSASPASGGPPSICPSLILPHTEARFMIPIESLMRASGELDIRGTSGRKLLHGSVTETPEGRRALALASCGCEDDPRITVLAPSRPFAQGPLSSGAPAEGSMGIMEIYGKGGKFYGTLEPAAGGGAMLRYEGEVVMSLEAAAAGDLRMTASSVDGRLLASAGKNVQVAVRRLESHDTWKLQVKPGLDAVLIAACMVSVMVFGQ
jgi:hypothetical protein